MTILGESCRKRSRDDQLLDVREEAVGHIGVEESKFVGSGSDLEKPKPGHRIVRVEESTAQWIQRV